MEIPTKIIVLQNKLNKLKKLDRKKTVFGSSTHQYRSKPISSKKIQQFEDQNNISIPEELRLFLTEIGTGAGPDYGIYNLSTILEEYENLNEWLDNISAPDKNFELTNEDARELIQQKKDNHEGFFYKRLNTVNGLLPIQTQGCTYYSFIVLNGEQRGKIWYLDTNDFDVLPAGIVGELSFFEWYEQWLDESLESLGQLDMNDQKEWEQPSVDKRNWLKKLFSW